MPGMQLIFLLDLLLAASFLDVTTGKIPNWITAGGSICALINALSQQILPFEIYGMLRQGNIQSAGSPAWAVLAESPVLAVLAGSPAAASLAGGLLALALLWPIYRCRALAAGDVKLLAMCGFWSGPSGAIRIIVYALICGSVMGVCQIAADCLKNGSRQDGDTGGSLRRNAAMRMGGKGVSVHRIHFAPAVLAGCVLALGGG